MRNGAILNEDYKISENYEKTDNDNKISENDDVNIDIPMDTEVIDLRGGKLDDDPVLLYNIDYNAGSIVYTIAQILAHCPCLHRQYLSGALWRSRMPAIIEILNDLQTFSNYHTNKNVGIGQMLETENKIKNLMNFDTLGLSQIDGIFHFFQHFISTIHYAQLSMSDIESELSESEKDVVMLRTDLSERDGPLPDEIGEWHLVFKTAIVEQKEKYYESLVSFRWLPDQYFQSSGTRAFRDRERAQIAIYVRKNAFDCLERDEIVNWSGGQRKVKCSRHEFFFIREKMGDILCTADRCTTPIRWRCPANAFDDQCHVGLCFKHFKKLKHEPDTVSIRYGPRKNKSDPNPESDDEQILVSETDSEFGSTDDEGSGIRISGEERLDLDSGVANIMNDRAIPLATTTAREPVYATVDSSAAVGGKCLLNDVFRCHRKTGYTRSLGVASQKLLQYVVNVCPENSAIPLTQPEAMLHPNIFWATARSDEHSVVGALPATIFSADGRNTKKHSLASLDDHLQVRLRDNDILTSHSDPYLSMAYDAIVNMRCDFNSPVVICKKGMEAMRTGKEGHCVESRESVMKFDEVDARRQVTRLSSHMRDIDGFDIFFTATCNDSESFGVKEIREAIIEYHRDLNNVEEALESYCGIMCRSWERTMRYFLDWVRFSPQKPVGDVSELWARFEFQNAATSPGNKPHVHGLFKIKNETEEVKLRRIRGMMQSMFHDPGIRTDKASLIADGLARDEADCIHLEQLCSQLQFHICEKGGNRCLVEDKHTGEMKCRVQLHPNRPPWDYQFDENKQLYPDDVLERLVVLNLAHRDEKGKIRPIEELRGGRYQIPADNHGGAVFVPTYAQFLAALRCVTNAQYLDGRMQASYCTKYVSGKDEKPRVYVKKVDDENVKLSAEGIQNEKRPGAETRADKKLPTHLARMISKTEMLWAIHELPFVRSDADYTHVNTNPPEYRACVAKHKRPKVRLEGVDNRPPPIAARHNLDNWRQFSRLQDMLIRQFIDGYYYADNTSSFSIRAPELMVFDNLEMYSKFFIRDTGTVQEYKAEEKLHECLWIDGCSKRWKLRQYYVKDATLYLRHIRDTPILDDGNERALEKRNQAIMLLDNIFEPIFAEVDLNEKSDMYKRFVNEKANRRHVVVLTPILPFQLPKFILHLCLTMGHIDTETDLLAKNNLAEAMVYAGLITSVTPSDEEINALIRNYIMDQLRWLSLSTLKFSRIIMYLSEALPRFFRDGVYLWEEVPLAFDAAINEKACEELEKLEQIRRDYAIAAIASSGVPNFPQCPAGMDPTGELAPLPKDEEGQVVDHHLSDFEKMRRGMPFEYDMTLGRAQGQKDDSYEEQKKALNVAKNIVDQRFVVNRKCSTRSPLICGKAGGGKTHLLMMLYLYCMSKGLNSILTAFTGERGQRMGGLHVHRLFGLPCDEKSIRSVSNVAEMALSKLVNNPVQLQCLKRLKVLLVEEISLVSSEFWAAIDLILRHVKGTAVPFGGVLLIASGDHHQLNPVQGHNLFTSYHMLTTFKVLQLEKHVRCADDDDLRQVQELLRQADVDDQEVETFKDLFRNRIPHQFVSTWSEVPEHSLKVLPTKEAVSKEIRRYERRIQRTRNDVQVYTSLDMVEKGAHRWTKADARAVSNLNYRCLEPQSLCLHVGAVMRLTYNSTIPLFSQGQLCVLTALPPPMPRVVFEDLSDAQREQLRRERSSERITVRLFPPGVRKLGTREEMERWPEVQIKRRESIPCDIDRGRSTAKREQWPFAYWTASTIHKIIGETCGSVATQISDSDKVYQLWEKNMLLVLLSRTRSIDDLWFVAPNGMESTLTAMATILRRKNHTAQFVDQTLNSVNAISDEVTDIVETGYVQLSTGIPPHTLGYVYLIVSCEHPDVAYVGETSNIRRRIAEHNSSGGSKFTKNCDYSPFAVLTLVTGFPGNAGSSDRNVRKLNKTARRRFEKEWHKAQTYISARRHSANAIESETVGRNVFSDFKKEWPELTWIQCGRLRRERR